MFLCVFGHILYVLIGKGEGGEDFLILVKCDNLGRPFNLKKVGHMYVYHFHVKCFNKIVKISYFLEQSRTNELV